LQRRGLGVRVLSWNRAASRELRDTADELDRSGDRLGVARQRRDCVVLATRRWAAVDYGGGMGCFAAMNIRTAA
jgi:hypothetical protein